MAIVDTNWQNFLLPLPDSKILPDASLLVKEVDETNRGGSIGNSVGAHAFLLASPSPVFRRRRQIYKKAPCHRQKLKAIPNLDTIGKSSVISRHLSRYPVMIRQLSLKDNSFCDVIIQPGVKGVHPF